MNLFQITSIRKIKLGSFKLSILIISVINFGYSQNNTPCAGGGAPSIPVSGTCNYTIGTNVGSTQQTNAANFGTPSCGSMGEDVWYTITAPASGSILIQTQSGGITDGVMALYTSDCSGFSNEIDCDDDSGPGSMPEISASGLTAGQTYYIRFWDYAGGTGTFGICVTTVTPPSNDDCTGATSLTVNPDFNCGSTTSGSVSGATASSQSTASCGGTEDDDVWFSFVATNTSHTVDLLNVSGSTTDLYHSIWEGACPALSLVTGTCSDPNSQTLTGLTIGNTYYVRVYTWTGTSGQTTSFDVCIGTPPPPPANDDPCGAITIPVNATCVYSTNSTVASTGTTGPPAPGCGSFSGEDVWFQLTVPASGNLDISSQSGTMTDGAMAIYSGTCGALTLIDCDDDSGPGSMPEISALGLTPGSTIFIRFWDYGGGSGSFGLCAEEIPPVGACAPVDMTINNTLFSQNGLTTCGFGDDYSSADACGSSYMNGDDYIIEYNPTVSGCVEIALTNTGSWVGVFVTDGCPDNPASSCLASETASGGNPTISNLNVVAGNSYYITVSTNPSPQCTPFDIDITSCPPPPANDDCTGAIAVPVNTDGTCNLTVAGTIENATSSSQANSCGGTANDDVWYSFVATSSAHSFELLNISGSTTDMYHSVYNGNCGAIGAAIVCSDPNSSSITGLTVGQTYYIRIYSWSPSSDANTDFDLCIQEEVPPVATGQDCSGAQTVCSDDTFTGNSSGSGNISDLNVSNEGCLSGENESSWYFFSSQTAGQIELTINTTVDYDFAIWGPLASATCPPSGSPIRCSFSASSGPTGLAIGSGDLSENTSGDRFVDQLDVNAGEVYILLIDNYTADGTSFDLDWTTSGGANLDCTVLDIESLSFTGELLNNEKVLLEWSTMNKLKSDHFIIEKANSQGDFLFFESVKTEGTKDTLTDYRLIDKNPHTGISYYRLKEVSVDGEVKDYKTISVLLELDNQFEIFPNPATSRLNIVNQKYIGKQLEITLYDVYGKVVKSFKVNNWSGKYEIDCNDMNSGLYTVQIINNEIHFKNQKVVIK